MKKELILGSLMSLTGIASAQNTFPASGNAGIGTTSPSQPLEVISSVSGGAGIKITQSFSGITAQGANLHLDNSVNLGGKRWALMSTGPGDAGGVGNFQIYDWAGSANRFCIKGSNGNIGIGNNNPANKLEVVATSGNDGVMIKQTGASSSDAASLYLNHTGGGKNWGMFSAYSGDFGINEGTNNHFFISGSGSGNVGMGTISPSRKLEVSLSNSSDDGVIVSQAGAGSANLLLAHTGGGRQWAFRSTGSGDLLVRDNTAGATHIFVNGSNGKIGFGTSTPANKAEFLTSTVDDGIKVTQNGNAGAWLYLNNTTSQGGVNGRNWGLMSSGANNNVGVGHFALYDITGNQPRIFINGNPNTMEYGHTGIGTTNPQAKLDVDRSGTPPSGGAEMIAIKSHVNVTTVSGVSLSGYAVKAILDSYPDDGYQTGVYGKANNGFYNTGGDFIASGGTLGSTQNYGVNAMATGLNGPTHAVHASATGPNGMTWAGYFQGNVFANSYSTPSDKNLKTDIKPLTNALSNIRKLKPSTYTFKTDENLADMHLASGKQMGLISQELEEVFPELVTNMPALTKKNEKGEVVESTPEFKSVQYIGLIPVLIAGVQEQQATIETQQKTIDQQNQINADLQKQLDEQKQLINSLSQKVSGATGIGSNGNVETGFQMSQNEPNPFTHETVVKYTLPQSVANAFMAVYDLTGKQISTFPIDQKGSASITITSEKLAAGIYIYSIVADGKVVDSKRMIVASK